MRKLIVFLHTSLDGFVAGVKGEMDWISADEQLFDYAGKLTDQSDTALYGRVTYQMMESYWPRAGDQPDASAHDIKHYQWYNRVDKVVISTTIKNTNTPHVQIISEDVARQIQQLKQQPGKDILVFGSPTTCHSFMQHNLIDDYWLFVNPVLIGSGIPVFKHINNRIKLQFVETNVFSSGVIALHYKKINHSLDSPHV